MCFIYCSLYWWGNFTVEFLLAHAHMGIMLIGLAWSLVSLESHSGRLHQSCQLMDSSPFLPLPTHPLSGPSSCQVSVSPQILQVFHQSGQLSVSNPHSEWEKLTELTLWSRITVGYRRRSLPLSPDPLLSSALSLAPSLWGRCWSACTGNHPWTAKVMVPSSLIVQPGESTGDSHYGWTDIYLYWIY